MNLILQAIKSLFRKVETTLMSSVPKKLTELENDLVDVDGISRGITTAQTTADAASAAAANAQTTADAASAAAANAQTTADTASAAAAKIMFITRTSNTRVNALFTDIINHLDSGGAIAVYDSISSQWYWSCVEYDSVRIVLTFCREIDENTMRINKMLIKSGGSTNAKVEVTEHLYTHATATEVILLSSTSDSTKKFKITVDDSGTLSAVEVTE